MNDQPHELIRSSITQLTGNIKLSIDKGCDQGCKIRIDLLKKEEVITSTDSIIQAAEQFYMKADGGEIKTKNGKIAVKIGEKSLKQDANFYILENVKSDTITYSPSGHPFEIDAETIGDLKAIKHFDDQIQIIYTFDEGEFLDPGNISLVYLDEATGEWNYLPTNVDLENHQLIGFSDHLTVLDTDLNALDKYKFNNLASAQTSLFTGAATYSYPLNLPTGPAGFSPSLTVTYDSNVVDGATAQTQASWVGMGWDLDGGSISRNTKGTNAPTDDVFTISLNGLSGSLIPVSTGTDNGLSYTEYKTEKESFWRIRLYPSHTGGDTGGVRWEDMDLWKVWDPSGNLYTFDGGNRAVLQCVNDNSGAATDCRAKYVIFDYYSQYHTAIWKWPLTKITNIFGQSIQYNYRKKNAPRVIHSYNVGEDIWVHSSQILYPNNTYQIYFNTSNRHDVNSNCVNNLSARCSIDQKKLDSIEIRSNTDNNISNGFEELVRKYLFEYNAYNVAIIFPNVKWKFCLDYHTGDQHCADPEGSDYGGRTLTLLSITEEGNISGHSLPTTTFSYTDYMHLTSVTNGYNGKVKFIYDHLGTDETNTSPGFPATNNSGSLMPVINGPESPTITYKEMKNCESSYEFYNTVPVIPGGVYWVGASINPNWINRRYQLYISGGALSTEIASQIFTNPDNSGKIISTYFKIPVTSFADYTGTTHIDYYTIGVRNLDGGQCQLFSAQYGAAVARYRVIEKQVYPDVATNPGLFSAYKYPAYATPAVNDYAHTDLTDPSQFDRNKLIHTPYSEFKGHSSVTEVKPDCSYTITYFNQKGITAGRVEKTETFSAPTAPPCQAPFGQGGQKLSSAIYTYTTNVEIATNASLLPRCQGTNPCADAKIFWYDPASSKNIVFYPLGTNNYLGTQEDYINQRDSSNLLVTNVVRESEIGFNGTAFSYLYRARFTSYVKYVTDAYYQINLPEVSSICADANSVNVSTHFASCGPLQSNYLSEYVTLYNDTGPKSLWKTLTLLQFLTPNINVTNDYQNKKYAATKLEYDIFGNVIKSYVGSKTAPDIAIFPVLASTKCYGDATTNSPQCASSTYAGIFLNTEWNALNQPTSYVYNKGRDLLLQVSDPNNAITSASYDEWGRIKALAKPGDTIDPDSPTLKITYHDPPNPIPSGTYYYSEVSQKRSDGTLKVIYRNVYDGIGNLIQKQTPNMAVGTSPKTVYVTTTFDYAGRMVRQSVPDMVDPSDTNILKGNPPASTDILTSYDALGRVIRVIGTDGTTTNTSYSVDVANHWQIKQVSDPKNQVTSTYSDVWGNTRKMVMADSKTTAGYSYDKVNRLVGYIHDETIGQIFYDIGGRKIKNIDPATGIWTYIYNDLGNLATQKDASGCTTTLTYDNLNRVTNKTFDAACPNNNRSITYGYDATSSINAGIGRRTSMTDYSGSTTWTYDYRGRVTSQIKTIQDNKPGVNQALGTYTTVSSYNPDDTQKQMVYPNNETVNFNYDNLGRQTGITNYLTDVDFDEAGRITVTSLTNNVITTNIYNLWSAKGGRLQNKNTSYNSTPLQNITYSYDSLGNIIQINNMADNQLKSYQNDSLNRIIGVSGAETDTFLYDNKGNLSKEGTSQSFLDTFDSKNTSKWTWTSESVPYSDSGNNVVRSDGTGNSWNTNFYSSPYSISNGQSIKLRFKVSDLDSASHFAIESNQAMRFAIVVSGGEIKTQYSFDGTTFYASTLIASPQINTWYVMRMILDDANGFNVQVYKESDPSVNNSSTITYAAGQSWRFHHWIFRATDYMDDYQEFTTLSRTYTYTAPITPAFSDSFNGKNSTWVWLTNPADEQIVAVNGNNVVQSNATPSYASNFYRTPATLISGKAIQVRFKANAVDSASVLAIESGTFPNSNYRRFGLVFDTIIKAQYTQDGGATWVYETLIANPNPADWYTVRISIDDSNGFNLFIYDESNVAVNGSFTYKMTAGLTWTFRHWVGRNFDYVDDYKEYSTSNIDGAQNAVTSIGGSSYTYNTNGNMATRTISGTVYILTYDGEGHMVEYNGGSIANRYVYDGDGNLVLTIENNKKTIKLGNFEVELAGTSCGPGTIPSLPSPNIYGNNTFSTTRSQPSTQSPNCLTWKSYIGGVAERVQKPGDPNPDVAYYILTDHLGGMDKIISPNNGSVICNIRYKVWGDTSSQACDVTDMNFTGQDKSSYINLYWYQSRWYDPELGRFLQPDPIVPSVGEGGNPNSVGYVANANYSALVVNYSENQLLEQLNSENRERLQNRNAVFPAVPTNPLALDRYAYCFNNPIGYNDPTGHNPLVAVFAFFGFTISAPAIIITGLVVVLGVVVADAVLPGEDQRHADIANFFNSVGESISDPFIQYRYRGDNRTARDIIGQEKRGSINQEFPSELLGKTADEINKLAKSGDKAAQKAQKLLGDQRFDKGEKRGGKE